MLKIPGDQKSILIAEIFLFLAGLAVFASFIHRDGLLFYLAVSGLLLSGSIISIIVIRSPSPQALFGLGRIDRKLMAWLLAGLITGLVATVSYRLYARWPLLPGSLTLIALISPLIGMSEEFIFRGYLQSRARFFGPYFAILLAATTHTFYKYLVIKSLGPDTGIDLSRLVIFTLVFGIIAATLREFSKQITPAVLAHAVFDILVYGDFTEMPVWVWS